MGENFRAFTYMIYAICYETLTLGGTAYVVFVLDYSGGWWVLGVLLSSGLITPQKWAYLWRAPTDAEILAAQQESR